MFPLSPLHTILAAVDAWSSLFAEISPEPQTTPLSGARVLEDRFVTAVQSVLRRHPTDSVLEETGELFWAQKKVPHSLAVDLTDSTQRRFVELTDELLARRPVEFDKDEESGIHVEWITCFANLRAKCYNIELSTLLEARQIAGNIVPALVTTTAVVASQAILQLQKLVAGDFANMRNLYCNLGTGDWMESEPQTPAIRKIRKDWR